MSGFEVEAKSELEPWAKDMLAQEDTATKQPEAEPERQAEPAAAPQQVSEADAMIQRMDILQPGDYKAVASLIEMHPELRDRIIGRAQEVCGNDTVSRALELLAAPAAQEAAPAQAQPAQEQAPPSPVEAVDVAAGATQAVQQPAEEFVYIVSPLALEYDRAEKIKDHVDFIQKNPQLRDKVIAGAAEFDPQLAADVEQALRGQPSEQPAPVDIAPAAAAPAPESAPAPAPAEEFVYITSFLALEYDRDQKIKDHVEFILKNPQLRDKVLIGAAEFDAPLAEAVLAGLNKPEAPPPVAEQEPTPPEVVQQAAQQAAPTPEAGPAQVEAPKQEEPKPEAEAGWVVRARAFNEEHNAQVTQFIQITGNSCLDANGNLDPNLVANWQVAHGVSPDGRIGEATVGAAIIDAPTFEEAQQMAVQEELPPPKPTDPAFAL